MRVRARVQRRVKNRSSSRLRAPAVQVRATTVDQLLEEAGWDSVDCIKMDIEETRVGQKTNYDKLTLEIWTNGSIGPEMAMVEAAKHFMKLPAVIEAYLGPKYKELTQ